MKKVRTHRFNGKRYNICLIGAIDGICDTKENFPSLVVACDPDTQNGLITTIHEAMHAGNWDKHEETIDRSSTEIGKLLWRLGWRRK